MEQRHLVEMDPVQMGFMELMVVDMLEEAVVVLEANSRKDSQEVLIV